MTEVTDEMNAAAVRAFNKARPTADVWTAMRAALTALDGEGV